MLFTGEPLEGWSVEFLKPTGAANLSSRYRRLQSACTEELNEQRQLLTLFCSVPSCRFVCKGRMGFSDVVPTMVADTSTPSRLSAAWIGTAGGALKVSMSTGFGVNDLYFTNTVTLQNVGDVVLYQIDWMRNVDPDQEAVRDNVLHAGDMGVAGGS